MTSPSSKLEQVAAGPQAEAVQDERGPHGSWSPERVLPPPGAVAAPGPPAEAPKGGGMVPEGPRFHGLRVRLHHFLHLHGNVHAHLSAGHDLRSRLRGGGLQWALPEHGHLVCGYQQCDHRARRGADACSPPVPPVHAAGWEAWTPEAGLSCTPPQAARMLQAASSVLQYQWITSGLGQSSQKILASVPCPSCCVAAAGHVCALVLHRVCDPRHWRKQLPCSSAFSCKS